MNLTGIVTGLLAILGLVICMTVLPLLLKKLDSRMRENITTGVYALIISYVAIFYVIRPLSVLFGENIRLF